MDRKPKIIRTWKDWTTLENAPIYEDMLINEVFPAVKKKGVDVPLCGIPVHALNHYLIKMIKNLLNSLVEVFT